MRAFTPRLHQRRTAGGFEPSPESSCEARSGRSRGAHQISPYYSSHCVERTLVVQDVKAFMDLKQQENSEKADIASHIAVPFCCRLRSASTGLPSRVRHLPP